MIQRSDQIVFNGRSSNEFDLAITGMNTYNSPEKDYTMTSVNGRNGDIFVDNKRFKNITVEYDAVIGGDVTTDAFKTKLKDIRKWLLMPNGYAKLSDTYDIGLAFDADGNPDQNNSNYRLGVFSGSVNFENMYNQGGSIKLKFNCKPQIFMSNSYDVALYTETEIDNDYCDRAFPLITGYSAGMLELKYGSRTSTILIGYKKVTYDELPDNIPEYTYYVNDYGFQAIPQQEKTNLDPDGTYYKKDFPELTSGTAIRIDCETYNVYALSAGATINLNKYVSFDGEPVLKFGINTIVNTDIQNTTLQPRWWII